MDKILLWLVLHLIQLEIYRDRAEVYVDNVSFGVITLYDNAFHRRNQYLKIDQFRLDTEISAALFQKLYAMLRRPLQIILNANCRKKVDFLIAGGFVRKRRCYAVEASADNFIGTRKQSDILHAEIGETAYDLYCKRMYERYAQTHKAINPLTANLSSFAEKLPPDVYYQKLNGEITHLAFVEDNEIAYVVGEDNACFASFAEALLTKLFVAYQTVCFEADDCDAAAMLLKSLFSGGEISRYDTFIYGEKEGAHDGESFV